MNFSPGLGFIPLVWAILTMTGVLFCYFYSVIVGHVYPLVPSISNTGTKRPEGDIFAETMNVSSFVCLIIVYMRFIQVKYRIGTAYDNVKQVNQVSVISGATAVFGITLVANFPSGKETTTSTVHDIGAVLAFIAAASYCTTQTFITWKMYFFNIDERLSWIYRMTVTCIMITAGSLFLLFSLLSYQEFKDSHSTHSILQWDQEDGGYNLHVFSNVSEWIGASCFLLFLASYFNEFQEINIVTKCIPRSSNCNRSMELEKLQESS